MRKNFVLLAFVGVSLSACMAAPGVKPQDANIFQAIGNINSGEFDRQLKNRKLDLMSSQRTVMEEKNRATVQQVDLAATQQELAELEYQLVALQEENVNLEQDIIKTKASTASQQRKKNQRLTQVRQVKQKIKVLQRKKQAVDAANATDAAKAAKYRREYQALQNEVKRLREISLD